MNRTIAAVALAATTALAIGGGVWLAGPRGQADAYRNQQSGVNRVQAQQEFHRIIEDVRATDMKLDVFSKAAKANPDDKTAQQNMLGTQTYCLSRIAEYNSKSNEYNSKDFRDMELPDRIDISDPALDCMPSKDDL